MRSVEPSLPTHGPGCLPAPPAGELALPSDFKDFQRRVKAQGRRAVWDALCPVCRARVRLGVARRFRGRAIILSTILIGNALISAFASKAEMAPLIGVAGIIVCILLACTPVWLRDWQLKSAQ